MPVSPVYAKLVRSKDDFLGILAYSVYKRQKADFIGRTLEKYGRESDVPEAVYESFKALNLGEVQLAHYRTEAEELLRSFADLALGEQSQQIRSEIRLEYENRWTEVKPTFFSGVCQSVTGSILFTILIGALIFFLSSVRMGVQSALELMLNVKITANQQMAASPPATAEATPSPGTVRPPAVRPASEEPKPEPPPPERE